VGSMMNLARFQISCCALFGAVSVYAASSVGTPGAPANTPPGTQQNTGDKSGTQGVGGTSGTPQSTGAPPGDTFSAGKPSTSGQGGKPPTDSSGSSGKPVKHKATTEKSGRASRAP